MKEFIEELKYNQNVNIEKGLDNRVDIDYVIERLERINNTIYDNGALMIGNIDSVIKEIKKEMKENIDMIFTDQEELLQELLDLKKDLKDVDIVYINYERPMGYELNYWCESDMLKESK